MGHLSPDYQNFLENYPRNTTIRPAAAYVLKRAAENAPLEEILNLIQGHGCGGISPNLIATKKEEKVFYQALKIINEKNSAKRWVIPPANPQTPHISNAHFIEYAYWGIQNAHLPVGLKGKSPGIDDSISINSTALSNLYTIKPTVPFIHPYDHYPDPGSLKLFGWVNKKSHYSPQYGVCVQKLIEGYGLQQLKPHYALDPNAPYFQKNYNKLFYTHASVVDSHDVKILDERGNCHIHTGENQNVVSPIGLFNVSIQRGEYYTSKVIYNNQQFITFHWVVTPEESDIFDNTIEIMKVNSAMNLEMLIDLLNNVFNGNKNFNALCNYLGILKD